ncbi:hypothetical protein [Chryseobacterium sp.]|uniref:hypothetical protein n=1 Tax=Chryseobacterium sp. TaxID=1871047 RepID=UPI0028965D98|nr:hypothetical protein [Chryseobacterium sp.]
MWIQISKDIFETADFKGLNYIYQILSWFPKDNPRYKIFIVPNQDLKKTQNYKNFKVSDYDFENLVEQQFNEFIQTQPTGKNCDYTITNQKGNKNFNIEEAIRFFSQPISIILENNKNDAYFIKAIINHLDSSGILKEYIANGWIRFENAGGCGNVRNFIEGELKSFEDLASRNSRNPHDYYKAFVLLDSDKEFPTQNQKSQYTALINYLNSININSEKFHLLEKRMMENYMPDEVFLSLKEDYRGRTGKRDLLNWINTYLSLTSLQKDFLNIKDGFPKETDENGIRKPIKTEISNLYINVTGQNFTNIDKGFKYPDFKNLFSELFYTSSRVNKASLEFRANSKELTVIVEKIRKLI